MIFCQSLKCAVGSRAPLKLAVNILLRFYLLVVLFMLMVMDSFARMNLEAIDLCACRHG